MFALLQNSYVKNLMPKIMVLGGGDFGRWVDHEGRTFKRMRLHERAKCFSNSLSNSLGPHELQLARLLCPWDSPGKNTGWLPCPPPGVLPHPGIEPTSLMFLYWQAGSLPLGPPGKPIIETGTLIRGPRERLACSFHQVRTEQKAAP